MQRRCGNGALFSDSSGVKVGCGTVQLLLQRPPEGVCSEFGADDSKMACPMGVAATAPTAFDSVGTDGVLEHECTGGYIQYEERDTPMTRYKCGSWR